ncbi:MAG: cadherin repeat domain-containing protein, partial [Alphaproteobacteria bacterium]
MAQIRASLLACLAAVTLLADCGGGGGGSPSPPASPPTSPPPPPPPPAPPGPPVFSSAAAVAVQENVVGVFYRAVATDPAGAPLTYAIAGGADAAKFAINPATHELRFAAALNFEAPADADANNVYDLNISASDGSLSTKLNLHVTVTDVKNGFHVRRISANFSQPIFLSGFPDGSGRVAVVERAGRIRLLDPATGTIAATDFLNLTGQTQG